MSPPSETQTGGCLCGQVRYEFQRGSVLAAHHCHCTDCQKSTGCGRATIVLVPSSGVHSSGELKTFTVRGSGGSHVTRGFCPECGSPILSFVEEMADLKFIKAGSLDDPSWVEVVSSFWENSALPWSPVDADVPALPGNPEA
ncbi:MAG TPA: aldehyde-activating protein [Myxococcales bacterium]|nr:aldehyde-activating protein [Myxococcales bacterium]HIL00988.1 aldehyde-activating protein [Myxococcales bacterium]